MSSNVLNCVVLVFVFRGWSIEGDSFLFSSVNDFFNCNFGDTFCFSKKCFSLYRGDRGDRGDCGERGDCCDSVGRCVEILVLFLLAASRCSIFSFVYFNA